MHGRINRGYVRAGRLRDDLSAGTRWGGQTGVAGAEVVQVRVSIGEENGTMEDEGGLKMGGRAAALGPMASRFCMRRSTASGGEGPGSSSWQAWKQPGRSLGACVAGLTGQPSVASAGREMVWVGTTPFGQWVSAPSRAGTKFQCFRPTPSGQSRSACAFALCRCYSPHPVPQIRSGSLPWRRCGFPRHDFGARPAGW